MKVRFLFYSLFMLFSVLQCSAQAKPEVLTNANVVKLFKAGLDNDIIVSKIESSACKFDISGDALVSLKSAGVPGDIIKAMMSKMDAKRAVSNTDAGATITAKKGTSSASGTPEPDLINAVYCYDKSLQSIKPLERNTAAFKTQSVMLGYGGTNFVYQIPGEKSSVRLTQENVKSFIVNTANGPADIFVLYKLQVKKKTRQAIGAKFDLGGAKGSQDVIAIDIKMIKPGLYELIPSTKLEKGEYFFTIKTSGNNTSSNADVYAFGLDS